MTAASSRPIALVVVDADVRAELARYLTEAGFAVHPLAEPPARPIARGCLVWITERDDAPTRIDATVSAWLRQPDARRAVVVTWRPIAHRDLVDQCGDRLVLLTPPIFAWDLVDALRATAGGAVERR